MVRSKRDPSRVSSTRVFRQTLCPERSPLARQLATAGITLSLLTASLAMADTEPSPAESLTDYSAKQARDVEQETVRRRANKTLAKPTAEQLAFQDLELGLFIHFGLPAYTGIAAKPDYSPALFDPQKLDCEQWVKVAKSMGAKYVVLTARHEGGFCIWPTKTTDYSVKSSPWKNGQGDVVREFVDACRKHEMQVGLYHPSWHDSHHTQWEDAEFFKKQGPEAFEKFTQMQERQSVL